VSREDLLHGEVIDGRLRQFFQKATKTAVFVNHDLQDIVTVFDGRPALTSVPTLFE